MAKGIRAVMAPAWFLHALHGSQTVSAFLWLSLGQTTSDTVAGQTTYMTTSAKELVKRKRILLDSVRQLYKCDERAD
jgi:hypothetical protein